MIEEKIALIGEQLSTVHGFICVNKEISFESSNAQSNGDEIKLDFNENNSPNEEEISRNNSSYSEDSLGDIKLNIDGENFEHILEEPSLCEILVFDPFMGNGGIVGQYDVNPNSS
jgi:hypothetical protein